jgi:hypothetical protein
MSAGSSPNTRSITAHFESTPNGWRGFRDAVRRGETAILGNSHYHYVPPGPTRFDTLQVTDAAVIAALADGRRIEVPIAWFPVLRDAVQAEREHFEFDHRRTWAFFPDLNTELSVDHILAYRDGADEEAFVAASASADEERLVADIGALVRKAMRVAGKSARDVLARVTQKEPLDP